MTRLLFTRGSIGRERSRNLCPWDQIKRRKRALLPPLGIKIVCMQPALKSCLSRRPFGIEHGKPGRIAISALDYHVLPENPLEGKAETQRRPSGRSIESVALPLIAAISEILKNVPRHQIHGLGRQRGALEARSVENAAHLDHSVRTFDPHIRAIADGP